MKLRASFAGLFTRRLRALEPALREAVADAAANALRNEIERYDGAAISVASQGMRRAVGSNDPADAAREFGTLTQPASPWLAPVLPLALEPMRAAANARVRELFAARAGKSNAAARALSEVRNGKR